MNRSKADFCIILNGAIFKEINDQYEKEQELMKQIHMLHSEMGEIYNNVFKCNEKIKLIKAETFGNIIIDDNHIVMTWDIDGCQLEFYYEQYGDFMELTIDPKNSEKAAVEIVKAFEHFYNKKFTYHFSKESRPVQDANGSYDRTSVYLEIFE